MLPSLRETAVILDALARIARRAAFYPASSTGGHRHEHFGSGHEHGLPAGSFAAPRPWPTAVYAAQRQGISLEELQARLLRERTEQLQRAQQAELEILHEQQEHQDLHTEQAQAAARSAYTPASSPERFEEELLASQSRASTVSAPVPTSQPRHAPSKPWPSQVAALTAASAQGSDLIAAPPTAGQASIPAKSLSSPVSATSPVTRGLATTTPVPLEVLTPAMAPASAASPALKQAAVIKDLLENPAAHATTAPSLERALEQAHAKLEPPSAAKLAPAPEESQTGPTLAHGSIESATPSLDVAAAPKPAAVSSPPIASPTSSPEQPRAAPSFAEQQLGTTVGDATTQPEQPFAPRAPQLTASKVPSSRLGRLFHYGTLGAGLAWGAAGSYLSGGSSSAAGQQKDGSGGSRAPPRWMSESNIRLLVSKLSTMRGAALKLGQFLSIQDSNFLPPELERVLAQVQNAAHYMPEWQLQKVMRAQLPGGAQWRETWFEHFEERPFAAASIGQVHVATLRQDLTAEQLGVQSEEEAAALRGRRVAVKVQFPGVKESIRADTSYLKWLVSASALLPRGLFLENTLRVMEAELEDECDYEREAAMNARFRQLVAADPETAARFAVPRIVPALCTPRVLVTEMMEGTPLTQAVPGLPQTQRDAIAAAILELSLRELFQWRLMQTDPNWTNFLWNAKTRKIELIDFGATREYSKQFMDHWLRLLTAAIAGDRPACKRWSEEVGYLTGEESETMLQAHLDSMIALGEPFRADAPSPYNFTGQTITARVREQIPVMLRERLTPPPSETYSLNRKLSGAFLLCAKLEARVPCRDMMANVTKGYRFGDEGSSSGSASSASSAPKSQQQSGATAARATDGI